MSLIRILLAQLIVLGIITSISVVIAIFVEGRAIDEVINTMVFKVPMLIGLLAVLAIVSRLIFRRL